MTRSKKQLLIALIFILLLVCGYLGLNLLRKVDKTSSNNFTNITPNSSAIVKAEPQISKVNSGSGDKTLIMKVEVQPDQSQFYSFAVINRETNSNEQVIFNKTVGPEEKMWIPTNSWAPDTKYFFLLEKDKFDNVNYLVLKSSGETFANNEQYLEVRKLFEQKKTGYTIHDATGWASPVFLNITTKDKNGKKGPSYWFDVNALAFWGHQ